MTLSAYHSWSVQVSVPTMVGIHGDAKMTRPKPAAARSLSIVTNLSQRPLGNHAECP